jgi:hypothetical protein
MGTAPENAIYFNKIVAKPDGGAPMVGGILSDEKGHSKCVNLSQTGIGNVAPSSSALQTMNPSSPLSAGKSATESGKRNGAGERNPGDPEDDADLAITSATTAASSTCNHHKGTTRANLAIAFAGAGWHVFPLHTIRRDGDTLVCSCYQGPECARPGKHPQTEHGLKEATTDPAQIKEWWAKSPNANIGLRTGEVSRLLVIDIDGPEGEESFKRLEGAYGPFPPTFEVCTGGGGRHLYFDLPPGAPRFRKQEGVKTCDGTKYPHVDIRAEGSYVVAIGSMHVSGKLYSFAGEEEPVVLPDMLARALPVMGDGKVLSAPEIITTIDLRAVELLRVTPVLSQPQLFEQLKKEYPDEARTHPAFGGQTRRPGGKFATHYVRWRSQARPEENSKPAATEPKAHAPGKALQKSGRRREAQGDIDQFHVENWLGWARDAMGSRGDWLKVGMALHEWDRGGDLGLELWDEFSQHFPELYNGKALEKQYRAFRADREADEITIMSLYHVAQQGMVTRLNTRIAFRMDAPSEAYYLVMPGDILPGNPDRLKAEYMNKPFYIMSSQGPQEANAFEVWRKSSQRREVHGWGADKDESKRLIETSPGNWKMNVFLGLPKAGRKGKAEKFKGFLQEVVASGRPYVYEWLLNMLAYRVQNPTVLIPSALVLYGTKGTGKNLFYEYIRRMVGERNATLFDNKQRLKSNFNSQRQGLLIEALDEIFFLHDPREENELKPIVTATRLTIEDKYVKKYDVPKFSWVLVFTNDNHPLRVSDDERRYTILRLSDAYAPAFNKAKSAEFYDPIVVEMEGEGPASLLAELLERDIDKFRPFPGLETEEYRELMDVTELQGDEWFREIVETGHFPISVELEIKDDGQMFSVPISVVRDCAWAHASKWGEKIKPNQAAALLRKLGFRPCRKGSRWFEMPPLRAVRTAWLKLYPKSPSFKHRKGWEDEVWEFATVGKYEKLDNSGLKFSAEAFAAQNYNVPFETRTEKRKILSS